MWCRLLFCFPLRSKHTALHTTSTIQRTIAFICKFRDLFSTFYHCALFDFRTTQLFWFISARTASFTEIAVGVSFAASWVWRIGLQKASCIVMTANASRSRDFVSFFYSFALTSYITHHHDCSAVWPLVLCVFPESLDLVIDQLGELQIVWPYIATSSSWHRSSLRSFRSGWESLLFKLELLLMCKRLRSFIKNRIGYYRWV